jgi:hypothetical protein
MVQHLDDLLSHGAANYDGLIRIELFLLALLEQVTGLASTGFFPSNGNACKTEDAVQRAQDALI